MTTISTNDIAQGDVLELTLGIDETPSRVEVLYVGPVEDGYRLVRIATASTGLLPRRAMYVPENEHVWCISRKSRSTL